MRIQVLFVAGQEVKPLVTNLTAEPVDPGVLGLVVFQVHFIRECLAAFFAAVLQAFVAPYVHFVLTPLREPLSAFLAVPFELAGVQDDVPVQVAAGAERLQARRARVAALSCH